MESTKVAGDKANTSPPASSTAAAAPAEDVNGDNKGDGDKGDGDGKGDKKDLKTENDRRSAMRAERMAQNRAAAEERRAIFAARIREMLTKAGFPDTTMQDAIIEHLASEEKAKNGVRESTRRLSIAIRRDVPPERLKDLITEYKAAVETERKRKEDTRTALDTKIGYSKNPRLEAFLIIAGILGDSTGYRFDLMQRQWGGQNAGQNGPQGGQPRGGPANTPNGSPTGNGNATPNANPNGNTPRPFLQGGRERMDRDRPSENRVGVVEAPAPALKSEAAAQPE